MDEPGHTLPRRTAAVGFLFLLFIAVIIARLFWLQIHLHASFNRDLENRLTQTSHSLTGRGKIVDRNGSILAEDTPCYQLAFIPSKLPLESGIVLEIEFAIYPRQRKFRELYRGQSGIVPPDLPTLMEKVEHMDERLGSEPFLSDLARVCAMSVEPLTSALKQCLVQCLKKWYYLEAEQPVDIYISRAAAVKIMEHPTLFPGVVCMESAVRNYPLAELAAHTIGYLGRLSERDYKILRMQGEFLAPGTDIHPIVLNDVERLSLTWVRDFLVGVSGAELVFNDRLRSRLSQVRHTYAFGHNEQVVEDNLASDGQTIKLTLDAELQKVAHESMKDLKGSVILFDLDSGDILVALSLPSFDPNLLTPPGSSEYFSKILQTEGALLNKVISGTYPFGSVYKIITAAAGLEEGILTPQSHYNCAHIHPTTKLTCLGYHNDIDLGTALERSCNIYFYQAGLDMKIATLYQWSLKFGLGKKSMTGLPQEKAGIVPNPIYKRDIGHGSWSPGDTCNSAIGQGYQLGTPLQAAVVAALVSRSQKIARPRFWSELENVYFDFHLRDSTHTALREGLWRVINHPRGTAYAHRSALIEYAGKTGTADIVNVGPKHPLYRPPHAWFAGFAPYGNPKVAIAVIIENGGHGGETAAPVAKDVLEAWFKKVSAEAKKG